MKKPPNRLINVICFGTLAVYLLWGMLNWKSQHAADYYQFWIIGQATSLLEITDAYSANDRARIATIFRARADASNSAHWKNVSHYWRDLATASTPLLYAAFKSVSIGDYDRDYENFRLASLIFFFGALIWLAFSLRFSALQTLALVFLGTYKIRSFVSDIHSGNVNEFEVGFLTCLLLLRKSNRDSLLFLTATLIGTFFVFKPTPLPAVALLALYWTYRRDRRGWVSLTGLFIGIAIGVITPIIIFGDRCSWFSWYPFFNQVVLSQHWLSQSLPGILGATTMRTNTLFAIALTAAAIATEIHLSRPASQTSAWLYELRLVWLGAAIYLVSGPLIHDHYFLFLLPLIFYLLRPCISPPKFLFSRTQIAGFFMFAGLWYVSVVKQAYAVEFSGFGFLFAAVGILAVLGQPKAEDFH